MKIFNCLFLKNRLAPSLLFCLFGLNLMAQAPQAFNYQTILRDPEGKPLANQNVDVTATFHRGNAAGPTVYRESFSNFKTSEFGLFSKEIGRGIMSRWFWPWMNDGTPERSGVLPSADSVTVSRIAFSKPPGGVKTSSPSAPVARRRGLRAFSPE